MAREELLSVEATVAAAEAAADKGSFLDAEWHYRRLVAHAHVIDFEYEEWARRLADLYLRLRRYREAGYLYLYLHYFDKARDVFVKKGALPLKARCFSLEKRHAEAATTYRVAGWLVHAAIAHEDARDHAGAAELWLKLLSDDRLRDAPYERALVHFNLGLAQRRASAGTGNEHLATAQRLLEQVADDFETRGERERAFDCYQILLKLGRDSGAFENLAEGYLSCIRILKDDGLRFYVLQYYEDFLRLALESEELHAAATLYREASEYCQRVGLPYDRHYLRRAAETWRRAAERAAAGGAVELAESAYLSAIETAAASGELAAVRDACAALGRLETDERKQGRWERIAARFPVETGAPSHAPSFPDYLRQPHAYAEVWFADLVEWELGGDGGEVAATIVGDLRYPDGFRRRALNLLLTQSDARARGTEGTVETLAKTGEQLGELQAYAALRPLERLYDHGDPAVRRSAVRALGYMHFKRSFVALGRALSDDDPGVRDAALEAVRALHFPHAFQPLARLFREAGEPRVKAAALESLGKLGTVDACELLVSALRHEPEPLREMARRGLATNEPAETAPILRQHLDLESRPEVRRMLEVLLGK